ncbi:poly(ADP-ribose) glycohydrolase-like isoform X2 [Cloeon dipterum]|uniref:poly(ADP-ribose) glycohydrolase-like isoform X2 n=1 Tax=Cloeon dipterum TaxID=197152 RepID=UPI00321FEAC8
MRLLTKEPQDKMSSQLYGSPRMNSGPGSVQEQIRSAGKRITSSHKEFLGSDAKFPMNSLRRVIDTKSSTERERFIHSTFPKICNLAQDIGSVNQLISELVVGSSVAIRRIDIARILANAFLCTFEDGSNINFSYLYNSATARNPGVQKEKLLCLIHYFESVLDEKFVQDNERVFFKKESIENFNIDGFYNKKLRSLQLERGSIFDAHNTFAQVIFSNKYLGGGVLGNGCLQEEICFLTCPELLVLKLLCPNPLKENEVVIVKDALQFVKTSGYAENMKFEKAVKNAIGPIILMDAIDFSKDPIAQWEERYVSRELKKAFLGFSRAGSEKLASGFWGCGAFKGDPWLKLAIQWIAASAASKDLVIHHIGDRVDAQRIISDLEKLKGKEIKQLIDLIRGGRYSTQTRSLATPIATQSKIHQSNRAQYSNYY